MKVCSLVRCQEHKSRTVPHVNRKHTSETGSESVNYLLLKAVRYATLRGLRSSSVFSQRISLGRKHYGSDNFCSSAGHRRQTEMQK